MLATVLLGMAAAGVLLPFASGATVQAEGMRRTLAAQLANDLMEQIVAGPDDAILSWDGHAELEGEVLDTSGVAFTDPMYARFSRQVSCTAKCVACQPPANFVLVTVTVAWRSREMATLSSLVNL